MELDVQGTGAPPSRGRREFIIGGALATTALLSPLLAPRTDGPPPQDNLLERLLPIQIGEWDQSDVGGVLIPKGDDGEGEAYDDVVTRYFTSSSQAPVMLLMAYGSAQAGNTQLHRPEVCYPAAGFKLSKWPDLTLPLPGGTAIEARSLTGRAAARVEQILYWSRVGQDFPTSSLSQRWSTFRQTLSGSIPDGILVRISTINEDREEALQTLRRFSEALLLSGGRDLRYLLTGRH